MKKLMIAVAIGCVAAFAQAASIDWGFQEQAKDSNSPYSLDGYSAYLFTESAWTIALAAGITADTFNSAVDSATMTKTVGGSGASAWTKWATLSPEVWTDDEAASGNYYVVLFNGDSYSASTALAATAYSSAQEAHTGAKWSIAASKTPLGSSDFTAAPEPTSAMLILLGIAGLALKRKRA